MDDDSSYFETCVSPALDTSLHVCEPMHDLSSISIVIDNASIIMWCSPT